MRSKWFGVFALLIAVFAVGTTGLAVAKKKPKTVKTSLTAEGTNSASTHQLGFSGSVSSPKSGCVAHRKILFQQKAHASPTSKSGLTTVAATKADSKGDWSLTNGPIAVPANPVFVVAKTKKLGSKVCKTDMVTVDFMQPVP
jgi:hypothetical protein